MEQSFVNMLPLQIKENKNPNTLDIEQPSFISINFFIAVL